MPLLPFGSPPATKSPLTTKGDLWGFDTANNRIPVGANNLALVANSGAALGVNWAAIVNSVAAGAGISVSASTGGVTITNTGLTSSPLTTKGDLWGFDTGQNRVPVGTNGYLLMADSAQTLGVGYSTHDADFNAKNILDMNVISNATSVQNPHSVATLLLEDASSPSLSASSAVINFGGTKTIAANSLTNYIIYAEPTFALGTTTGGAIYGMDMVPLFSGTGSLSQFIGFQFTGSLPAVTTSAIGASIIPSAASGKTVAKYIGVSIGGGAGFGTSTLSVGLDIGVTNSLTGTTVWNMQCGNNNSYHQGKFTFGGTGTPTWDIHVQGGNAATNGVGIDVSTTGPTAPASNGSAVLSVFKGTTNYYLLVTFNDAGTTRYRYMELNGTTATWTEGTSLPT